MAPPLIVIAGPTGSGKSELALRLAEKFAGEVVSCDSVQVYRRFDIGTAKLGHWQRRGIPHHLIDVVDPGEVFTAGDYARAARPILREISARGRVPMVVGGTGVYLRALLDGLAPAPARDDALRARLVAREQKRPGSLHRLLKRLDPAAVQRIHARNVQRTVRALEVRLLRDPGVTGAPPDPLTGFHTLKIGLDPPRAELYRRVDLRLESMFHNGLIEEVRALLDGGIAASVKPFESLGYKQALAFVQGALSFQDAVAAARLATRHYAKRQLTWFRCEPDLHWLQGFGDQEIVQNEAIELIEAHLNRPISGRAIS